MFEFSRRRQPIAQIDLTDRQSSAPSKISSLQDALASYLTDLAAGKLDCDIGDIEAFAADGVAKPALMEAIRTLSVSMTRQASTDLDLTVELCIDSNEASISGAKLIAASVDQSIRCQGLCCRSGRNGRIR